MVAEVKEKNAIATPVKPSWVAIIYLSGREAQDDSDVRAARGLASNVIAPALRLFQIVEGEALRPGMPTPYRTFHVHHGSNLGVHVRVNDKETITRIPVADWEAIAQQPINAHLIEIGALQAITPENGDEFGEPGYRHFSEKDALQLVKFHMHCAWVDRALVGETRPAVLTAANQRKEVILAEERRMQSGEW